MTEAPHEAQRNLPLFPPEHDPEGLQSPLDKQVLLLDGEAEAGAEPGVASPFLPGTAIQYAWDSTSLGWFKGCPRLYQYMMVEGWRPKEDSDDLRFGIEYHWALEENDRQLAQGLDWLIALRNVVRGLLLRIKGWKTENSYKNPRTLLRSVVWYIDKFKDDPAETLMLGDGVPAVEVTFRFELDWGPWLHNGAPIEQKVVAITDADSTREPQPYLICGHLDRVVSFQGATYIMDRKTTKSEPSSWFFSGFEPDNQMTIYTLAGQVVLQTPIKGVIIDAAQIQIDETRFGRGFTFRQKEHIEEWLYDLKFTFAQAEDYAAEGYWPMNDKYCGTYRSETSGKTGCPFREICSQTPRLRANFLKSNFVKLAPEDRWNPLKAR